jgi:hypothetical protein
MIQVNINNTDLEISLEEEEERVNILSCYICDNEDHDYHPLLTCNGCRKKYVIIRILKYEKIIWNF